MIILGGGISGRLLRFVLGEGLVLERNVERKANNLTRMWGTNYLWEPLDGIACEPFPVTTHVDGKPGTPRSIARYKRKIGKPEDIGDWGLQFKENTVGYNIAKMPDVPIMFVANVVRIDLSNRLLHVVIGTDPVPRVLNYRVLFSTIPLNTLVYLAQLSGRIPMDTAFRHHPIYVRVEDPEPEEVWTEGMYVNYNSDPTVPWYRMCVRDSKVHREFLSDPVGNKIRIYPGKIRPSPLIKGILEKLQRYDVYCFGRFARWEPNELVHETYKRIRRWKSA